MNKKVVVDEYASVKADIDSFSYDVPSDIYNKVKEQLKLEKNREQISASSLNKELLAVCPKAKGKIILAVILAILGEVFSFASYFFCAYGGIWLYHFSQSGQADFGELLKYAFYAFLAIIVYLILTAFSTNLSHRTAFEILAKLRTELFEKLNRVPLGYLIENPLGKIKVTLLEKVGELEDWVAHVMPEMPSKMVNPLLASIILFFIDWRIGLSIFAPLPVMILGMALMMRKYRARGLIWTCSYENVADRSTEYVKGIPVIKAFLQEDKSYAHFSDAVKFYYHSTMDWWKVSWFSMSIMVAAAASPLIVTLPLSLKLYALGQMEIGELILTLALAVGILPALMQLMMTMDMFMIASNAWLVISELLNQKEQERPSSETRVELDRSKGIEFKHVNFSYKEHLRVLKDINFKANRNEMTALVGPSGSGKSTIAKLICSYWDVEDGEITLGGVKLKDISFAQLMEEISYVSQDNFLFDTTIKDNIKLGKADASDEEVIAAAKMAHCDEFIRKLPLAYDTKVGDAGGLLSGGERQRITLARAILKPANIIILDEATAYADPENEALIQAGIAELVKDKTLIVIAHRLHTIKNAEKILVVDQGKILAEGTDAELMENCPLYAKMNRQYQQEVEPC